MLNLSKFIRSSKSAPQQRVIAQVVTSIEIETSEIQSEIDSISKNRLPSPKIKNSISNLRNRCQTTLESIDIDPNTVEEFSLINDIDNARRLVTLERYSKLISKDEEVRPYAVFYELLKALENAPPKADEVLNTAFREAVRSLFNHPNFADTMVNGFQKKAHVLGLEIDRSNNLERKKMELFLQHYHNLKKLNPRLCKNVKLEATVGELEAILYLQNQAEILAAGGVQATQELINFINYWAQYLSGLPDEEQKKRATFIGAVERCSSLHNSIMNN